MELNSVRDYVSNRLKVAETYMEHGLVVESRDVYQQISRNLNNLKKKVNGSDNDFLEWFGNIQGELEKKLATLDREIGTKSELAGSPPWYSSENKEEENPRTEFLKGIGLKDLGFLDDAAECFRRSLNNGYSGAECLSQLLDVCKQKEDSRDLAMEIRDILDLRDLPEEEKGDLWRKLGIYFEKTGMREEALRASEMAKECAGQTCAEEPEKEAASSLEPASPVDEEDHREPVSSASESDDGEKVATLAVLSDLNNLKMETEEAEKDYEDDEEEDELVIELREEIEHLQDELARATELVAEYQKRYTAIMSQTNALQRENRELKEKLAKHEPKAKTPPKQGRSQKSAK